jgi:tetratricopeptide (TPR) repeat protein
VSDRLAAADSAYAMAFDLASARGSDAQRTMTLQYQLCFYADIGDEASVARIELQLALYDVPRGRALKIALSKAFMVVERDDHEAAAEQVERVRSLCEDVGGFDSMKLQRLQGCLALAKGEPDVAEAHLASALAIARRIGCEEALACAALAAVQARLGKRREATALLNEANQYKGPINVHADIAETLWHLGDVEGSARAATDAFRNAWAQGPPFTWARSLARAKRLLARAGAAVPELPSADHAADAASVPEVAAIRALIAELKVG